MLWGVVSIFVERIGFILVGLNLKYLVRVWLKLYLEMLFVVVMWKMFVVLVVVSFCRVVIRWLI